MPVPMLPQPQPDHERFRQLDAAIRRGRGDVEPRRHDAGLQKRERLELEAARMRAKNAAQCSVDASREVIGGFAMRGMPWCRPCFVCGNPAWCRHREQQLQSKYRPPEKP